MEGHGHWSGQMADKGLCPPESVLLPPGLGHVLKTIQSSGGGCLVTAALSSEETARRVRAGWGCVWAGPGIRKLGLEVTLIP